jgi:hypothetical protein
MEKEVKQEQMENNKEKKDMEIKLKREEGRKLEG